MAKAQAAWALACAMITVELLSACPEGQGARERQDSPGVCTKAYEKCELGKGLLGICDVIDCAPGVDEPCLQCRSQH